MAGLSPEQKQLAESFVRQGYTPEQAAKKAREVAPTAEQARAQKMRRARKGGKK